MWPGSSFGEKIAATIPRPKTPATSGQYDDPKKTAPPKRRRANDLVFNSDCYTFLKQPNGTFGLI